MLRVTGARRNRSAWVVATAAKPCMALYPREPNPRQPRSSACRYGRNVRRRISSRPQFLTGIAGTCLNDQVDQELARFLLDLPRVLLNLPREPVLLLLPCPRARAAASPLPPVELLCPYSFCSSTSTAAARLPVLPPELLLVRRKKVP